MSGRRRAAPLTPLGALVLGLVAGAAGTLAMDTLLYVRYRREGGDQGPFEWELSAGLDDWDDAPAPAQVGRLAVEKVLRRELPASAARTTNNVMHWLYGTAWGAQYGVVVSGVPGAGARTGLVLGPVVWGSGYVVLPFLGLYKPIWEYDARTLWRDFSAHLVYGVATAAVFRAVARSRR